MYDYFNSQGIKFRNKNNASNSSNYEEFRSEYRNVGSQAITFEETFKTFKDTVKLNYVRFFVRLRWEFVRS